jgi:hypothetical protein
VTDVVTDVPVVGGAAGDVMQTVVDLIP